MVQINYDRSDTKSGSGHCTTRWHAGGGFDDITGSSGWELAFVTAQTSSSSNQLTESKLAGGFDKLLLDSLYENAARQQATTDGYGNGRTHQIDPRYPCAVSTGVAPPTNVQTSMMAQKQQQCYRQQLQQQMMLGMPQPFQPHYAAFSGQSFRTFGDPYSALSQVAPLQWNHGGSSLIRS